MNVDKFGRHENSFVHKVLRGPPGEGFQLTHDGNYDLKRKRLCNLADPINNEDATNLKTIRTITLNCETVDGIFDAKNKRIQNIASAIADTDAVNREFVLREINKLKKNINDKLDKLSIKLFTFVHSKNDVNQPPPREENHEYIGMKDTEVTLPLLTSYKLSR